MTHRQHRFDAVIIGGGPAGSVAGRLLASLGHRVAIVTRTTNPERGLVETVPPSARKLLQTVGVLDAVEHAGFQPNRGNLVWWGSRRARDEGFDDATELGFQVHRPRFDAVLLEQAERAGAEVWRETTARSVEFHADDIVRIVVDRADGQGVLEARFVVDASGRAGVVARRGHRTYQPRHVMQALVGVWRREAGFDAVTADRTIIETYDDGWAWSLPVTVAERQIAVMVDGATTRTARGPTIADTYRAEVAKTHRLQELIDGASLERAWACDASMHSSRSFAGPQFLLVGDAATCIDPLSSFGVKKALASAWLGAIALHTTLIDPDRQRLAFDFFSQRERDVYAAELARTEAFANEALVHHGHPFWAVRGAEPLSPDASEVDRLLQAPAVAAAYDRLRAMPSPALCWRRDLQQLMAPRVAGCEIVLDAALPIGTSASRFAGGVDLLALGDSAAAHDDVPTMFDAYQQRCGAVDLAAFLRALSLLLAEGLLEERTILSPRSRL